MTGDPRYFTSTEAQAFDKRVTVTAQTLMIKDSRAKERRPSGTIRTEFERAKLGLTNLRSQLTKAEEMVVAAKQIKADSEWRLKELRDAGYRENSPEVQKLTGYTFAGNFGDKGYKPGTIARADQAIADREPRVQTLKEGIERETKRLRPQLEKLVVEFNESLRIENLTENRGRQTTPLSL
ncbi:MAG: hypothetical protein ACRD3L_10930 [Terriglobales bacterium]